MTRLSPEQVFGIPEVNGLVLYPLLETARFEDARALGEIREWKDLSDMERIGFEVAEILHSPTWVNNFPLYIVRDYRPRPAQPKKCENEEWWMRLQKYYDDIDTCIEKLGFEPKEIDSYTFQIGGDSLYNELMLKFGASIYREMRILGYDERQLRS